MTETPDMNDVAAAALQLIGALVSMQVSGPSPVSAGICAIHVLSAAASGPSNEKMRQWCAHPLPALMLPL